MVQIIVAYPDIIDLCKKNIPPELSKFIVENKIGFKLSANSIILLDNLEFKRIIRENKELKHYVDFFDKKRN